jgi:tRNA pseudouridine38-40 synthase
VALDLGRPGPTARLLIEYDGTEFSGWARQPGRRTVQVELERALCVLLRRDAVPLTVAGRTDTGVHATGQVASYSGEPARSDGLNALLPYDVAVLECVAAPPGFDARRDATSRAYCYRVLTRRARSPHERRRALHWPQRLDLVALRECARALEGIHDFTAFTPTGTRHVRFERYVYEAGWHERPGGLLEFVIEADSFMRNMNRVLVGTMLEVAQGRRSVAQFTALLAGRPRHEAGLTAPPHGLHLVGVGYDGRRVGPLR